ncbi:MAG: 50S ribosomal protein L13 [Halobacteriales archaeon]
MKGEAEFDADEATLIDGEGAVLGRLASTLASESLDGEKIVVVNTENVVVSGEKSEIVDDYRGKVERSVDRGPFHPRRPEGIANRAVRGMLPYKKQRGKDALSRVRFYVDVPAEYEGEEFEEPDKVVDDIGKGGYVTLGEISDKIGANVTW